MRLGIRAKLFLVTLALITVSVVVADAYLGAALDADLTARVQADLLVRLNFVEQAASSCAAGLDDHAAWDRLADELGRRGEGRVTIVRRDGVVLGDSELDRAGVAPDFQFTSRAPDRDVRFIHRRTDEADIYFVTNHQRRSEEIVASFRVDGKRPEMWDAVTGKITPTPVYEVAGGRVRVPIRLEPSGSVFVVFRPGQKNRPRNPQGLLVIATLMMKANTPSARKNDVTRTP